MKTHTITETHITDKPAYLANGLIGLRIGAIPLPGGAALVNGFNGLDPERRSEAYADAPYPIGADLELNGIWLSERPDLAHFIRQDYNFSNGELTSLFKFSAGGASATVEVLTFCSRTNPALTIQEVAVTVDQDCTLTLRSQIDPRGLEGKMRYLCHPGRTATPRPHDCDNVLQWESRGALATVGAACRSECSGSPVKNKRRNDFGHEEDRALTDYTIDPQAGQRVVLRQIGALVPSLMHEEPHWQASRMVSTGSWRGFDELRERNRAAWADLWKGRIRVTGTGPEWQEALDAAFFYLHSTVTHASPCSAAPFGLSRRAEYMGHVFWDTESFMFPPVLLTAPRTARGMLDYRSRLLPAARYNAMLNGYTGLQFPWQSGTTGSEVTPYYCEGQNEHHINMEVAFTFVQYVYASGDEQFLREQAWPVLKGVSEWICSRVEKTARGYEIRHIVGVDEGIHNINNNAYTNLESALILRESAAFAKRLGYSVPAIWLDVADHLYIPVDPETQVIMKHDQYRYTSGKCVPETLGAFYPLTCKVPDAQRDATFRYHLDLAHTYLGMPMFSSTYAVWAARMGDRQRALEFFKAGVLDFQHAPYLQASEMSKTWEGLFKDRIAKTVFLTNPAGFLMACLTGLTGLELDAGDPVNWGKHPVVLPEGWESIEVDRIFARGGTYSLVARHGDERATIKAC